jgi:hypothetical protein
MPVNWRQPIIQVVDSELWAPTESITTQKKVYVPCRITSCCKDHLSIIHLEGSETRNPGSHFLDTSIRVIGTLLCSGLDQNLKLGASSGEPTTLNASISSPALSSNTGLTSYYSLAA